jgi:hypothetical protein
MANCCESLDSLKFSKLLLVIGFVGFLPFRRVSWLVSLLGSQLISLTVLARRKLAALWGGSIRGLFVRFFGGRIRARSYRVKRVGACGWTPHSPCRDNQGHSWGIPSSTKNPNLATASTSGVPRGVQIPQNSDVLPKLSWIPSSVEYTSITT